MTAEPGWSLVYDAFRPDDEGLREALCTLGNGYFATRGAAEEAAADDTHYPGTYIAGVYNRLDTTLAGRTITDEDMVNCPNWLPLTFRVGDDDRWFNLRAVTIDDYRQELDLKVGMLVRRVAFTDPQGRRFRLASRRIVHREKLHLAALELVLSSPDWSGPVTVRSGLDGLIINAGVARYRDLNATHLEIIEAGATDPAAAYLLARTSQSRIEIAVAARTRLFRDDAVLAVDSVDVAHNGFVGHELAFTVAPGDSVRIEKVAAFFTSRASPSARRRRRRGPRWRGSVRSTISMPGTRAPRSRCGAAPISSSMPTTMIRRPCASTFFTWPSASRSGHSTAMSACRRAACMARPIAATSSGTSCSSFHR